MPQGIKLSNQLYPATGDQILSQAEYIHDSNWQGNKKDQQSINAKIKQDISTINNNYTTINNKVDQKIDKSKLKAGSGLFRQDNQSNNDIIIGIDNTVYGFLENPNNKYPGCIKGIIRGDVNEDGIVNIADVTSLIDMLLSGEGAPDSGSIITNILTINNGNILNSTFPYSRFRFSFKTFPVVNNTNSININNTVLENHIQLYDIASQGTTTGSSTLNSSQDSGKIAYFEIQLEDYWNSSINEWSTLESTVTLTVKLVIGDIPDQNEIYILASDGNNSQYINQDLQVSIEIEDPDNLLKFPRQGQDSGSNVISIADVTALIDFILQDEWYDQYYNYFSSDSLYLLDNENNLIPTCPGVIYQGIDKDGNYRYFIAREYKSTKEESSARLYPIKLDINNLDTKSLVDWLRQTIIVDNNQNYPNSQPSNIGKTQIPSQYIIGYSFEKYNNEQLFHIFQQQYFTVDDYNEIGVPNIINTFFNPNKQLLEVQSIVGAVEIPIYFYDIDLCKYGDNEYLNYMGHTCDGDTLVINYEDEDLQYFHYTPIFYDGSIIARLNMDDIKGVKLVDKNNNPIDSEIKLKNPISKYPCITLRFLFDRNPDNFIYVNEDGGYFTLKQDLSLKLLLEFEDVSTSFYRYIIPNNFNNPETPIVDKLINFKIRNL